MADTLPKVTILDAYKSHLSALRRFIARIVNNQHDVDDVAQEAFLRAYKAEFEKTINHPKSYLFRTAENVALGLLRHQGRRPTDYLDDVEAPDIECSDGTLEEQLMAQERLGVHCAAVAALPPKCRKVYVMRKVHGMSYKAIADAMEITVSTVETHMEKGFSRCDAYVSERLLDREGGEVAVRSGAEVKR